MWKPNEAFAQQFLTGQVAEPAMGKTKATYDKALRALKARQQEDATKEALKSEIKKLKAQVTRSENLRKTRCAEFTKTQCRWEERVRRLHKTVAELKGQIKSSKTHKGEIQEVLSALDGVISKVLSRLK